MKKVAIRTGAMAGITGCAIDVVSMFVLGNQIDGYNQLKDAISQIGISSSPVASQIDTWWIIVGCLLILFGIGIMLNFENHKQSVWGGLLIIIYGMGEGLGSGLLSADEAGTAHSFTGILHILIGGVGVIGIMFLPLVMMNIVRFIKLFSIIIFFSGLVFVLLFILARVINSPGNFIVLYKGIWQRAYLIIYYIYLVVLAIIILKDNHSNIPSDINSSNLPD